MCQPIRADEVTTDRNTIHGSHLDIVLYEVCNTPSLVCFAPALATPGDRKMT